MRQQNEKAGGTPKKEKGTWEYILQALSYRQGFFCLLSSCQQGWQMRQQNEKAGGTPKKEKGTFL